MNNPWWLAGKKGDESGWGAWLREGNGTPLIRHFLNCGEHKRLLTEALHSPSPENRERLDQAFRRFYCEIRLIHYINQTLFHYARHYYRKKAVEHERFPLLWDQPDREGDGRTWGDRMADSAADLPEEIITRGRLVDQLTEPALIEGFKGLTKRQQSVLEWVYLYRFTHRETAKRLGISPQAVSRTVNRALDKLRKAMEKKDEQSAVRRSFIQKGGSIRGRVV